MPKVLLINGSPHPHGCTFVALDEVRKTLEQEGIETEMIHVGHLAVRGCTACRGCWEHDGCIFTDDPVNETARKFEEADGLIVGSPVYYASPNGTLIAFLDRLFQSSHFSKHMKVGASVVSCRRGGNTASFDVLNKYFTISGMPLASSTYWNQIHGCTPEEARRDLEGLQVMRNLGRNMAFLIRAIAAQKEKEGLPPVERKDFTSFMDVKE
ncbi:MAG: flavodoxin family protein [Lachnospiraceae bacterium]|nr:flavodoxin family protein [Lachnospiraceae bacterium]